MFAEYLRGQLWCETHLMILDKLVKVFRKVKIKQNDKMFNPYTYIVKINNTSLMIQFIDLRYDERFAVYDVLTSVEKAIDFYARHINSPKELSDLELRRFTLVLLFASLFDTSIVILKPVNRSNEDFFVYAVRLNPYIFLIPAFVLN